MGNFTSSYVICIAILASGCASTTTLAPEDQSGFDRINKLAQTRTAEVTLANNQRYRAANLVVTADSISWHDPVQGNIQARHISDIRQIRFMRRDKGALIGFESVALSILTLSGIAVLNCRDWCPRPSASRLILASTSYGLVGAAVGIVVGFREKYVLTDTRDTASLKPENHSSEN